MKKIYDAKATNPKDAIGGAKMPLDLVPESMEVFAALAFAEGALKYGKFNWRVAGVKHSVYIAALKRHVKKLQSGEWADKKTKVPHLANILACAAIALDAKLNNKLVDDRPPRQKALVDYIDGEGADIWNHLQVMFKDHKPKQYTIADSQEPE